MVLLPAGGKWKTVKPASRLWATNLLMPPTNDADFAFRYYNIDLQLFYVELELDQSSVKAHIISYIVT